MSAGTGFHNWPELRVETGWWMEEGKHIIQIRGWLVNWDSDRERVFLDIQRRNSDSDKVTRVTNETREILVEEYGSFVEKIVGVDYWSDYTLTFRSAELEPTFREVVREVRFPRQGYVKPSALRTISATLAGAMIWILLIFLGTILGAAFYYEKATGTAVGVGVYVQQGLPSFQFQLAPTSEEAKPKETVPPLTADSPRPSPTPKPTASASAPEPQAPALPAPDPAGNKTAEAKQEATISLLTEESRTCQLYDPKGKGRKMVNTGGEHFLWILLDCGSGKVWLGNPKVQPNGDRWLLRDLAESERTIPGRQ